MKVQPDSLHTYNANRFIVLDCFGDKLHTFDTLAKAKNYTRNKPDCTIKEITLFEILGECRW
jgi:hypothetical protein